MRDVHPVDAHVHFYADSPALTGLLDRLNLRFVNISVLDPYEKGYETLAPQHAACREILGTTAGRGQWVSSFDPAGFESKDFAQRVIAEVEETFRQGAAGVKIYKTIGMDLRTRAGKYVMPDDPAFAPILDAIAVRGKVVYAHIAEPLAAWKPLDPSDPDYSYYAAAPKWHMYGHPEKPGKAAILAARDRMLAAHPKLRVVRCHLGSMEENVDDIAARFDRYPNLAVDTSGRVTHLALQPRDKVRSFLVKYQDRILYGTDDTIAAGGDVAAAVRRWSDDLNRDWKFFATEEIVRYEGRDVRGLALPEPVLRKLFHDNAARWVGGIPAVTR